MPYHMYALGIGFVLDLCLGDPQWLYHPVRLIGRWITMLEGRLRMLFPSTEKGKLAGGACLVLGVLLASGAVGGGILVAGYRVSPWLGLALESWICYQMLAMKSLKTESMKVYYAFRKGDAEGARFAVSMIVGRDTASLSEEGIQKAAVETVAENTSDGVIAPLFYMALFGGMGGILYKAINTMDSMVGYKNETYLCFGRAAAKLDDIVNWFPSRLSAVLMIAAAWIMGKRRGFDGRASLRIFLRDRFNHKSPNSAQTEAACAGALGVQLAGPAYYFGKLNKKPYIGDGLRNVENEDIPRANRLLYGTGILGMILAWAIWILAWKTVLR